MKKTLLLAFASLFSAAAIAQQDAPKAIYYSISFPNAAHHEAEITMTIPQAPTGPLLVRMSRSSAGRYATHEFGKNIYNVAATDVNGKALELKQVEGDVYSIEEHPSTVKVSYTLFGNWTDGTYASIDPRPRPPEHARHFYVGCWAGLKGLLPSSLMIWRNTAGM